MFDFGKFLEQKYLEKGWTQQMLAEKADVDRSTLRRWIEGKNFPRLNDLHALADALGVPVTTLITGESDTAPNTPPTPPTVQDAEPTPVPVEKPLTGREIVSRTRDLVYDVKRAYMDADDITMVRDDLSRIEGFLKRKEAALQPEAEQPNATVTVTPIPINTEQPSQEKSRSDQLTRPFPQSRAAADRA